MPNSSEPVRSRSRRTLSSWAGAFGRFLRDFLIGDTPGLFVGAVVFVGLIALLTHSSTPTAVVVIAVPLLVVANLLVSVARAARGNSRGGSEVKRDQLRGGFSDGIRRVTGTD
ncbi:MAG TPA: hypothetical protein VEJ87_11705 [Acidimicrobiales bacterium]|nr:hypothetical protein [Acidimicrobiales bacterium]